MTNEELARKYAGCEYCRSKDKCTNDPEERCCDYNLTEEIAEIKDKQFKELIDKKLESLREEYKTYNSSTLGAQIMIMQNFKDSIFKED